MTRYNFVKEGSIPYKRYSGKGKEYRIDVDTNDKKFLDELDKKLDEWITEYLLEQEKR